MDVKAVVIEEAQTQLAELLALVEEGIEIILMDQDKPRARLVSLETSPRIPGLHSGAIQMSDDFDEPLPDDFWLGSM